MKPQIFKHRRTRLALTTAIFILFALVFLLFTPPGRVLAQQILHFFTRTQGDTLVLPTVDANLALVISPTSANLAAAVSPAESLVVPSKVALLKTGTGCGTLFAPRCRIDEIQSQVVFPIQALTGVNDDLAFLGASLYQGGVVLGYDDKGILLLIETPESRDASTWQISRDAKVQAVIISGRPGEYVRGGWTGFAQDGGVLWDETLPTQTLRWAVDGMHYTLLYTPGKLSAGPNQIPLERLVALADGIMPARQAQLPTADPNLSFTQIARLAGFELAEPASLPARFALRQTRYNPENQAVCLYYNLGQGDLEYPLVIVESKGNLPPVKKLWPAIVYEGKVIEVPKPEELVVLQGADGGHAELASNGLETNKICGGKSLLMNNALLWKAGGRNYAIFGHFDNFYGEGYVTRMETIRMAESLMGIKTTGDVTLDPQRLFSASDAQTVSGFHVLAPARMLTSLHLDHITYPDSGGILTQGEEGWPKMVVTVYTRQSPSDFTGDRIMILQVPHPEWTLAQRKLEGGFNDDKLHGQPAIYQELCWQETGTPYCHQRLIWLEGDMGFEVMATFPALLPKETLFEMMESMQ